MNEKRKMNRLRSLEARISRARGQKRLELLREYDRVRRSLGRLVWVSKAPEPVTHLGEVVEAAGQIKVDGTYKKREDGKE